MEVRKRNHYISQMILKGWAFEDDIVYLCPLTGSYFKSSGRNIKSVACEEELYVMNQDGIMDDYFEVWMAEEIESPASRALERARRGEELSRNDWNKLSKLIALQYVRSPKYKEAYQDYLMEKEFYLSVMKKNLEKTTDIFQRQKWSVIDIDRRISLPLGDNAVVSVSLDKDNPHLDAPLDGDHTMVFFPISPKKVLYYRAGKGSDSFKASKEYSSWIKELICQNSTNMVISHKLDHSLREYIPKKKEREKQFTKSE